MRQLPAQTSDTPAPRRATDPPRAPLSNLRPAQRKPPNHLHGPPPRLRTPSPPRLQPNPPTHRYAPARRVTDPPRPADTPSLQHAPQPPDPSSQVETQKGPTAYYLTVGPSRVVPRAGARMLVTGGDYCVFICGHQVIEHQFVMPFVEVVEIIPGKCVSCWKRVLKMWSNCGQIWGIQETRLCKVIKNQQFTKSCRASGGNRTRTTLSGQGILSPSCLPFHHQGKAIAPQPLRQSHCAAASVSARWNADWSQIYKLIADVCKIILND